MPIQLYFLAHTTADALAGPLPWAELAIAKAGVKPGACFFTGDVAACVESACLCGMDAAPFRSQLQPECDPRARGVGL
jgi:hypothetical protein